MARVMSVTKDRAETRRKSEIKTETLSSLDSRYYHCSGCGSWQRRPKGHNPVCPKCETLTVLYPSLIRAGKTGSQKPNFYPQRRERIIEYLKTKDVPIKSYVIMKAVAEEGVFGFSFNSYKDTFYEMIRAGEIVGVQRKYMLRSDLK